MFFSKKKKEERKKEKNEHLMKLNITGDHEHIIYVEKNLFVMIKIIEKFQKI